MSQGIEQAAGYLPTGFQALISLIAWGSVVLLHGLGRSTLAPEPDPIRPSGPTSS